MHNDLELISIELAKAYSRKHSLFNRLCWWWFVHGEGVKQALLAIVVLGGLGLFVWALMLIPE